MRGVANTVAACSMASAWLACVASASADPQRLIKAYPDHLAHIESNNLVWRDGSRMPIDEGRLDRDHETMLATADIKDMFAWPYPRGPIGSVPARLADPGRARNAALFDKMYGNCMRGEVSARLVMIPWLPKKGGRPVQVTTVNRVHEKLAAVSAELDELPARFDHFLVPSAGTYVCRPIAGTSRVSAHGHGIAIDISTAATDYWLWNRPKSSADAPINYRNRIPEEIVAIFERHGFIWGGAWYHYDTMHFEYRPELLARN